jgi:DNA-binding transcriptional ArsR family regulator
MEDLAGTLRVLADPTRLRLLETLLEGDATVSELAACLDLPQPRVSAHLAPLRGAGLVEVQADGRQRAYHVDEERISSLLDALRVIAPAPPGAVTTPAGAGEDDRSPNGAPSRAGRVSVALRQARTCYGHLAGVAGVALLDELLRRGWIEPVRGSEARTEYRLTEIGELALRDRGVDVARAMRSRRLFAFGCPDWTERRPHLGGALGAAILDALAAAGSVRRGVGRTVALRESPDRWFAGVTGPHS